MCRTRSGTGKIKGDGSRIYDFCFAFIDSVGDLVSAFKSQIDFATAHCAKGQLERLMAHKRRVAPQVPIIQDAKRGDISRTDGQYAIKAFERCGAAALRRSRCRPSWASIRSRRTSSTTARALFCCAGRPTPGGDDLQNQRLASVDKQLLLYEHIAHLGKDAWNLNGQLRLVVCGTYPAEIELVKALAPAMQLLIPSVGAQGRNVAAVLKDSWRWDAPIISNSTRAMIYAFRDAVLAEAERRVALKTHDVLKAARG